MRSTKRWSTMHLGFASIRDRIDLRRGPRQKTAPQASTSGTDARWTVGGVRPPVPANWRVPPHAPLRRATRRTTVRTSHRAPQKQASARRQKLAMRLAAEPHRLALEARCQSRQLLARRAKKFHHRRPCRKCSGSVLRNRPRLKRNFAPFSTYECAQNLHRNRGVPISSRHRHGHRLRLRRRSCHRPSRPVLVGTLQGAKSDAHRTKEIQG